MFVVFFIDKAGTFYENLIGFMERHFPNIKKRYYIIDRHNEKNIVESESLKRISSYKKICFDKNLRKDINTCDKIIASGIFTIQYVMPFFSSDALRKTYLQFWGGDMYRFRSKSLRNFIDKPFYNYCVKKSKAVITMLEEEQKEFLNIFPYDKKFFSVVVPNAPLADKIFEYARNIAVEKGVVKEHRIVVGNSATVSNQHLKIFKDIKSIGISGIEILCPLSYGEMDYRDQVMEEGKKLFGDDFKPITEYMPYDKFVELLSSCDVGLYNHNRQQGLGNISIMLNMGKKVYVRSDGVLWNNYKKYGFKLCDIENIKNNTVDDLFSWTIDDMRKNIEAFDVRKNHIIKLWKEIIED